MLKFNKKKELLMNNGFYDKEKEKNLVIEEIKEFQINRNLHKQDFEWLNETTNIVEELLEIDGYSVPSEKRDKLKQKVKEKFKEIVNELDLKKENKDHPVDGFADIIVFSIGAIMKMEYEPVCVLSEVAKEINSRTGKIINGKFIKDTSKEAKKRWYKADHSKCIMKKK
jgi:hypothetical protein